MATFDQMDGGTGDSAVLKLGAGREGGAAAHIVCLQSRPWETTQNLALIIIQLAKKSDTQDCGRADLRLPNSVSFSESYVSQFPL